MYPYALIYSIASISLKVPTEMKETSLLSVKETSLLSVKETSLLSVKETSLLSVKETFCRSGRLFINEGLYHCPFWKKCGHITE